MGACGEVPDRALPSRSPWSQVGHSTDAQGWVGRATSMPMQASAPVSTATSGVGAAVGVGANGRGIQAQWIVGDRERVAPPWAAALDVHREVVGVVPAQRPASGNPNGQHADARILTVVHAARPSTRHGDPCLVVREAIVGDPSTCPGLARHRAPQGQPSPGHEPKRLDAERLGERLRRSRLVPEYWDRRRVDPQPLVLGAGRHHQAPKRREPDPPPSMSASAHPCMTTRDGGVVISTRSSVRPKAARSAANNRHGSPRAPSRAPQY